MLPGALNFKLTVSAPATVSESLRETMTDDFLAASNQAGPPIQSHAKLCVWRGLRKLGHVPRVQRCTVY